MLSSETRLEQVDPEDLRWILEGVQTAINARYTSGSAETPVGLLIVHLDFTLAPTGERPPENVASFVREGYAFLVLSMPIVRRIFEIRQEVGLTLIIHGVLGLNPSTTKDKANTLQPTCRWRFIDASPSVIRLNLTVTKNLSQEGF